MLVHHLLHCRAVAVRKSAVFHRSALSSYRLASTCLKSSLIVFDIDETLCYSSHAHGDQIKRIVSHEMYHRSPECEQVMLEHQGFNSHYVFRPYFDVLLKYLLAKDAKIAFLSAGIEDRNIPLINNVLTNIFGAEKHASLSTEDGQFGIYSRHHMRRALGGDKEYGVKVFDEGHRVKDMSPIFSDYNAFAAKNGGAAKSTATTTSIGKKKLDNTKTVDENTNSNTATTAATLSHPTLYSAANSILIDDNPEYASHDQTVVIFTPGTMWDLAQMQDSNQFRVKNNMYYFLGVFKTFYEDKQYSEMQLRAALTDMIPHDTLNYPWKYQVPTLEFELAMVAIGLEEVRKTHPEAIFYGLSTYQQQDTDKKYTTNSELFTHSVVQSEALLDSILSGEKAARDGKMIVFLRSLCENGIVTGEADGSKYPVLEKKMGLVLAMLKTSQQNSV